MDISVLALNVRKWDKAPPLKKALSIWDAELSGIGVDSLEKLAAHSPAGEAVSWQALAIQEFADIQDQTLPQAGRYFNINFFYFEACAVLREAIVSGLNGTVHASLAALRAAFELFVLHCYWKVKRRNEDTYDDFYAWFSGTKKAPGFQKFLPECYDPAVVSCATEQEGRDLYSTLCTYVHKPTLDASITKIRGGNLIAVPQQLMKYWIDLVHQVQRHALELLVRASPACLFPIDITRKFGFNPPVGLFFDHYGFRLLEKVLGENLIAAFRTVYQTDGEPPDEIKWANARPNLTDAKILKSWRDLDTPRLEGKSKADKMRVGRHLLKAKMRVIAHASAYMTDAPPAPDVRAILAALAESDDKAR